MIAYHFCAETLRDGSPIPPVGEWEVYTGPVKMCESGLHYSLHPFDALQYAPGSWLRLIEVDDVIAEQSDKGVCRRRRTLQQIDAAPLLREFARWCALQVIHLWNAPPIVRKYLETGAENLRAVAWDAASAARDARDADWAATSAAAWAARDARDARDACNRNAASAARDARDAAWDACNRNATWDATWDAAWDAWNAATAAGAAQRIKLQQLVDAAFAAIGGEK
jgi:hypothetical protein